MFQDDAEAEETYDLGGGETAKTPDEAMEKFLKREFEDILGIRDGHQHKVKLIPDSYIYGKVAEQVS